MKTPRALLPVIAFAILLATPIAIAQVPSLAQCRIAREQFTALNDKLLLARGGAGANDTETMNAGTHERTNFITAVVLARLQDGAESGAIQSYLDCMQEGVRPQDRDTNTPQVFISRTPRSSTAVASMLLMRGGSAIPSTRPFFQCFAQIHHTWTLLGQSGEELDGHTFFIHPLQSPVPGESWYLLSGTTFGDTGGRLHLEVVSCSASQYRRVWDRDGFLWGEVEMDRGAVIVTYEKRDAEGNVIRLDPNRPDRKRFTTVFRVTDKGLTDQN